MPTYEYLCRACGTRFEAWQKMTDEPLTTCGTCGGPVHRVLYPAGVVFKGGGFYSTDNRPGARTASEGEASASGEKAGDKSGEKSTDKSGEKSTDKSGEKSTDKSGAATGASSTPATSSGSGDA
jgi:putative FmdB family regulatory protein